MAKADGPESEAPSMSAADVAGRAATSLAEFTGHDVEAVIGIERRDGGWRLHLEAVELRRVPPTTDLLAVYEIDLDQSGELSSLRRLRRYQRGQPREDEES